MWFAMVLGVAVLLILRAMRGPCELDSLAEVHHKTITLFVPLESTGRVMGATALAYLG